MREGHVAKPDSIRKFDWLYLGSIVVGMIGLALGWGTLTEQMNQEFIAQGIEPDSSIATGALIGGFAIGTAISLALWFLISVLRIEFVKWILVLFVLWSLVSLAGGIALSGFDMIQISGIVSTIMSIAAIYMLFQPDAKEWFAAKRGD